MRTSPVNGRVRTRVELGVDPEVTDVEDRSGAGSAERPAGSSLPGAARAVVIGAGIVGNSLVHHLAELGWTDLVLIDKGPLPNPGGLDRPRLELHLSRSTTRAR